MKRLLVILLLLLGTSAGVFAQAATEPPATEPPATEPPATEPPATEPPATEPPATEPPAKGQTGLAPPIKHAILYLYKSDFGETAAENDGLDVWAFPLEQLGFTVDVYDTKREVLPTEAVMKKYHGILAPAGAWETSVRWATWLKGQMEQGRPVLVMAPLGPGDPAEDSDEEEYPILPDAQLNEVYRTLGLALDSTFAIEEGEGGENIIRWKYKAPGWFGYDKDLVQGDTPFYLKWTPQGTEVRSLLTLEWEGVPQTESAVVAFTPRGGLAIEEYIKFVDFASDETRWRVDPVRFLGEAFRVADMPRPECNVICGQRTMLCHLGGTGLKRHCDDGHRSYGRAFVEDVVAQPAGPRFPIVLSRVDEVGLKSFGRGMMTTNGYDDVLAGVHNVRLLAGKFPRFSDPEPDFRPDGDQLLVYPTAAVPIEDYFEQGLQQPFGEYFSQHEQKLMLLPTQRPEPLNIFIPYDLAETLSSRRLLARLLDWAGRQETTPVYLDEYLAMARAGRHAKIGRTLDGGYYVEQDGALPSLRFDRQQGYPDMQRCIGVIGYRRQGDSLYVYLDEGKRQTIYLSQQRPQEFSLARANRPIRDLHRDSFRHVFTTRGPTKARLEFRGLQAGHSYVAELFERNTEIIMDEVSFRADEHGAGVLEIAYPGWARVEFWSSTAESYWLVKVKRFFWRTGTLPVFIIAIIFLICWLGWKLAGLFSSTGRRLSDQ